MFRSYTYEVTIEVGGKPEIEGIYQEEKVALERADYLLKMAKYTAVRVFQVNSRESHKLIFEKFYTGQGTGSTISEIRDAFFCVSVSDVYSFDSRQTLLKLLRSYFDQQLVIPIELLHNYMMLRYLERDHLLYNQALHRIAGVQSLKARMRAVDRYDALAHLFREVLDNAKTVERLAPYAAALSERGLDALIDEVTRTQPAGDHSRVITYAIARYTAEARDWTLKLAAVCRLFEEGQSDPASNCLDEVLAEIVAGNEPIRAIVGYAPDLISALEALLATIDGCWDDRLCGTDALQKLSDIMAGRPLPRVREALLMRVAGAIDSKAPLTKLDRVGTADAFKRLIPKLREFGGFMGGVKMSAAVTRRAKVVLGDGVDDLSFENAVSVLLGFLPTPAAKIGYLLDLLSSDMGRRKAAHLTEALAAMFSKVQSIYDFAPDVDSSWSQEMVREDFRRRLTQAGIPRRLVDGLLRKLTLLSDAVSQGRLPRQGALLRQDAVPVLAPSLAPAFAARPVPHVPEGTRGGSLVLGYRGSQRIIEAHDTPFIIGRGDGCHLFVDWGGASRSHAVIEMVGSDFVLVDHSKNGTFVRGADDKMVALANTSLVLTGCGTITIGTTGVEPEARELAVILFQRVP